MLRTNTGVLRLDTVSADVLSSGFTGARATLNAAYQFSRSQSIVHLH